MSAAGQGTAGHGAADSVRTLRVLVLALGGEGGAVLADWLVEALEDAGFPVQATSVPGVAQRTGATSYYIECLPLHRDALGGVEPVFCLSPTPGQIDVLVSSELLETGRAIERGFVTPGQTTLVSSTSRFLTVQEKMHMGDGRLENENIVAAARALSRGCALFDMSELTAAAGTIVSSVLYGALAGCGRLPLTREQCEAPIRAGGRSAEASLRGFAAGFEACRRGLGGQETALGIAQGMAKASAGADASVAATVVPVAPRHAEARTSVMGFALPSTVAEVASLGAVRLVDYQDEAYARRYVERVHAFAEAEQQAGGDFSATRTAARFLALWLAYEDIIRVADLKSRSSRFARIRSEFGAAEHEPVVVRDFLKPGVEEVAAILPSGPAARLARWSERTGRKTFSEGLQLQTSSVGGLLLMRGLARLRGLRRRSSRFAFEQALVERWSNALLRAFALDLSVAAQVAECPRLIKGYSDTFARGRKNFVEILEQIIEPGLKADGAGGSSARAVANGVPARAPVDAQALAASIRRAREAALADPEGRALAQALGRPAPEPRLHPVRFVARKRPR